MAKPEISSKNGAFTFINFRSFGFNIIFSFWKYGDQSIQETKTAFS